MQQLAIIATHPIQYNAPWFSLLAKETKLKVFYTWSQRATDSFDPDFNQKIDWDIPLLEGYEYSFIDNIAKQPGAHHFNGIKCPKLIQEIERWEATHILILGWNYHAHLKAMRYFKGKIQVWFRGDSTLLDYDIRSIINIRWKHVVPDAKQLLKFKLRKVFLTWVYKNVDKTFYVGKNNLEYFLQYGLKINQLVFAPHAIENERFSDDERKNYLLRANQWKNELGINNNDIVFLYAGKFEPRKNIHFFLTSFITFKQQTNLNVELLLLGNGPLEKELIDSSLNYDFIHFLPFQNQSMMPVVYRLADYYCLPSQSETWGLAINEAIACGIPVLVSDKVGCAIDLVTNNTGRIFESNNETSLINALKNCSQDRVTNLNNHLQEYIKNWSFESICNAIKKELNE